MVVSTEFAPTIDYLACLDILGDIVESSVSRSDGW